MLIEGLPWDPEMESPATIAILGAGSLGIEAALYARFLGYHVSIFESRRVAHRMLDWNNRPLDLRVDQVTTSLGIAALDAHLPDYTPPSPDRVFTGKEYAEEYLLPLAKTELLFDDIHFLSPVVDISRFRSRNQPDPGNYDDFGWQERCNDEFRILVAGRHRGMWISRADCIIDCRGSGSSRIGLGPAGGLAIGESELRKDFLQHLPKDRKFDPKLYDQKRILLVGDNREACIAVQECLEYGKQQQLIWVLPPAATRDEEFLTTTRKTLNDRTSPAFVMIEALGVDTIQRTDGGEWHIQILKDDESTVEVTVDAVASRTEWNEELLGRTLLVGRTEVTTHLNNRLQQMEHSKFADTKRYREVLTAEPGYFRLRAELGMQEGFERLRTIFALLGGRADLDVYAMLRRQNPDGHA